LYRTLYLRQSVYDALVRQAKDGARIYLDSSVPLDIPATKRLGVDLGMGELASKDLPPAGAHLANPGPQDYGYPDRIKAVGQALREYIKPPFECDDERLVAHPFEYDGVKYVWYVNALSGEEYRMCQSRLMALRTAAAKQEVIDWEKKELREHPTFEGKVRYRELPGVPYDLWNGERLETSADEHGTSVTLSMDRFGGTFVAFYPSPIERVTINCQQQAKPMETVKVEVTVTGKGGPMPGTVPVEFELLAPNGDRSPLSRIVGTERGMCTLEWTPAVNDVAGNWTITARDCASGKEAKAAIVLGD
jgi:hypothetical protein